MDLHDIRQDYKNNTIGDNYPHQPMQWFSEWMEQALDSEPEPTAFVLSTVGDDLKPASRIVLLKKFDDEGFTFFTNYESRKAFHMAQNPYVSMNFFWTTLQRQVRIEGIISKISSSESDRYFQIRPFDSRVNAIISPQSKIIPDMRFLHNRRESFINNHLNKNITRPQHWGGYIIKPFMIEFWQGGANRLHERVQFTLDQSKWQHCRLAP